MKFAKPLAFRAKPRVDDGESRLLILRLAMLAGVLAILGRLFVIQILDGKAYAALASGQHGIFDDLFPERGEIYLRDPKSDEGRFPAAVNRTSYVVFADTKKLPPKDVKAAADLLGPVLGMDVELLRTKLSVENDPYVPLARKLDDAKADEVRLVLAGAEIKGIGLVGERARYYPEGRTLSHVTGFLGSDGEGGTQGRYGLEGAMEKGLRGERGFLDDAERALGFRAARDGDELTLTIDRSIQYAACERLRAAVTKHRADGGTVVIADPKTGAILAMCSVPDYDPNAFSEVEDISVFNNPAVFAPYEPGSIFKPVTMAAGIDAGRITPSTTYNDEGSVRIGPYTIRNSDGKTNGIQTMTQVLEKSLNTGMIFVAEQLGAKQFLKYVEQFGFGSPTGIELDTEVGGDIEALRKKGDIWSATGSFGQGISATPMQMVAAYGAIANGGKLMKPFVVAETKHPDGKVVETESEAVRQVITKRASSLVAGMLVNVVERGHGKRAAVPGYWVAGKTGTAQIARTDGQGYEANATIGSFVGFAPVDDPAFVMLVKLVRPRDVEWAESSAAPLFGDIAKFLLQYLQIPPDRAS